MEQELNSARELASSHVSYFAEHINRDDTKWHFVDFEQKPYGPFEQIFDLFGDGSVVLAPLGGHTKGSIGAIVTTNASKRYFFIGDVSWSLEAIKRLRPKAPFVRNLVDLDGEGTSKIVQLLHQIWQQNPDILIVPTHDGPVVAQIAQFPEFE
jgi:glyoxylase-like metal-dependent hydrolase (beta-lactamase superfamily II)